MKRKLGKSDILEAQMTTADGDMAGLVNKAIQQA